MEYTLSIGRRIKVQSLAVACSKLVSRQTYNRHQLYALRKNCSIAKCRGPILDRIVEYGLMRFRGTRAGKDFQRPIPVVCHSLHNTNVNASKCQPITRLPPTRITIERTQLESRLPLPAGGAPRDQSAPPSLYVLNANSIAKPHAIESLAAELIGYSADVAIISETHLKKKHSDSVSTIDGYSNLRRDRLQRRGGGVAVYARSELSISEIVFANDVRDFELLWTKISAAAVQRITFVGALYHPPKPIYNTNLLMDYIESTVEHLVSDAPGSLVILAGDLNSLNLTELQERTGLTDLVSEPTRGPNILDHVLVSEPSVYEHIKVVKAVGKSDHSAIVAYNGQTLTTVTKVRRKCEFRKKTPAQHASFLSCAGSLNTTYFDCVEDIVQESFDNFYTKSLDLLNRFYPLRTVTITSSDPPYITPEIKSALRRKNTLMRRGRCEEASALALKIGSLITKNNAAELQQYDDSVGSKTLWDKVKAVTGRRSTPAIPLGVTAGTLNAHYAAVSTDNAYTAPLRKTTAYVQHPTVAITEQSVFSILDRLSPTATGPDGLPAWFLRVGAPIFAKPLALLFNQSISTSNVPAQWKTSTILPIPKIALPKTLSDYRPISITSVLSRILERIVVSTHLYPVLSTSPAHLNLDDQYAFRPTGSTAAALVSLLQTVSVMLETQPYVRVIALDFSKAFDSVRHSTLLEKLSQLDLQDNIYNWIVDFVEGRAHCTRFNDEISALATITASVVQGSALGPAAYAVAASDLHPVTPGNDMKKFADDTYLVVPANNSSTCDLELAHLENWSTTNNLKLNRSKCSEIVFVRRSQRQKAPVIPSEIVGIPRVTSMVILGVTVTNNFSFKEHIDSTLNSCSQSLHALRTLRAHGLKEQLIHKIYQATVLSKIMYCSPVWRGFLSSNEMCRLESFLRKSIKLNFCNPNQLSFEMLFNKADSVLFNKIISNPQHVLYPLLTSKVDHAHNLRRRAHDFKLPSKSSKLLECNFITRLLYTNIY
jgi:hypothetical protein